MKKLVLALFISGFAAYAQSAPAVTLTMNNVTVQNGAGGSVDIVINSAAGSEPDGVQFSLSRINGSMKGVTIAAGKAATDAGKQLACNPALTICIVYGLNANTIKNGVLATVSFTGSGAVGSYSMPIVATVAADADASLITSTGVAGTLSVVPLSFDLNGDGKVDASDVRAELDQVLGIAPCSSDFNGDSKCDLRDTLLLIQAALTPAPAAQ